MVLAGSPRRTSYALRTSGPLPTRCSDRRRFSGVRLADCAERHPRGARARARDPGRCPVRPGQQALAPQPRIRLREGDRGHARPREPAVELHDASGPGRRAAEASPDQLQLHPGRRPDRRGEAARHPRAPHPLRPVAALGQRAQVGGPVLVQAEPARVRRLRGRRGEALQGPRRPLQHLERAQLEDLARPARRRSGYLPRAVHVRLHGDQAGRPQGEGADRRDEPLWPAAVSPRRRSPSYERSPA